GPAPATCRFLKSAFLVGAQSLARGDGSRPDFARYSNAIHGAGISRGQAMVRRRGRASRTPNILGRLKRDRSGNARFPAFYSRIDSVTLAASGASERGFSRSGRT